MSKVAKPAPARKPHRDFPLTPHASGRWCKKVKGHFYYFGRTDTDPEGAAALQNWRDRKDAILAGDELEDLRESRLRGERRRQPTGEAITVDKARDEFLSAKEKQVESGEITKRHFADLQATTRIMRDVLGSHRAVEALTPDHFRRLRDTLAQRYGAWALSNAIQRIRSLFKFVFDDELIAKPVRFGAAFAKPSKSVMRRERAKKGERLFSAADLKQLIDAAGVPMKAMILLGVNCGLGNSDCGQLRFEHLNLAGDWLSYPRPKTGIDRRCKLWPETIEAIEAAIAKRPTPKSDDHADLAFITKYGFPWANDTPSSPVGHEFRKLLDDEKLYRPGLSFYTLRHQFATIAGAARDQVAVDYCMGHCDPSVGADYRESIGDDRLEAVAQHVHQWLFPAEEKPAAKPQKKRKPKPEATERVALRIVG